MTGIILFAHGSRVEDANESVRRAARDLAGALDSELIAAAFLELGAPGLAAAADELVRRGAARLVVIPYFLTLGVHMQRDLPRLVEEISARHGGVPIEVTPPLEGHPGLLDVLLERARAALS